MRMERYLTCYYCNYVRGGGDDGRSFDEVDPYGLPDRGGDPALVCQPCIDSAHSQCECCGAYEPIHKMPYESRHGMAYCHKCWSAGCDLTECDRVPEGRKARPVPSMVTEHGKVLRWKRDKHGKVMKEPAFSTPVQNAGPTDEELAATYKSLGFEYHLNTKPEEGTQ